MLSSRSNIKISQDELVRGGCGGRRRRLGRRRQLNDKLCPNDGTIKIFKRNKNAFWIIEPVQWLDDPNVSYFRF